MPRTYHYTPAESSTVASISYDPDTQDLWVVFRSNLRFRYKYKNVPYETVCRVQYAKSVGSNMKILVVKVWGKNFEKEDLAEAKDGPTFEGATA